MEEKINIVTGYIVDVFNKLIYPASIEIENGIIKNITRLYNKCDNYILPGFIDAHIHIESSMLVPSEFARLAVIHGTVGMVTDPHEIGNVLGVEGVRYMIENAAKVPLKLYFGAPSCVPASPFETAGAKINADDIENLLNQDVVKCLSEMMNVPAVVMKDPEIFKKLNTAKKYSKLVDGHAPGLMGEVLQEYYNAGISTEHECNTKEEALEKLDIGMKIQIREGSAAKNFDDLLPIINDHFENLMFCSDDMHPYDLTKGYINNLVKRALANGIDIFKVLQVASVNPVLHYGLNVGLLRIGDPADFIIVDNLRDMNVIKTYINGEVVAEKGKSLIKKSSTDIINNFNIKKLEVSDFAITNSEGKINIIEALDGQVQTNKLEALPLVKDGLIVSDVNRDILKIVVVNRYKDSKPTIGFVTNFGLKKGAIASSISHDSHNIIAVGVSDEDICRAVNLIIEKKGGLAAVCLSEKIETILPLPVAGLMSNESYNKVSKKYRELDKYAKWFGSKLTAPFMTLSFMALLVMPSLKMSDKGLFDGEHFGLIDLFVKGFLFL